MSLRSSMWSLFSVSERDAVCLNCNWHAKQERCRNIINRITNAWEREGQMGEAHAGKRRKEANLWELSIKIKYRMLNCDEWIYMSLYWFLKCAYCPVHYVDQSLHSHLGVTLIPQLVYICLSCLHYLSIESLINRVRLNI